MGDRQRSWDHSFACAWHDGEPCTCKDASDRPLTAGEGATTRENVNWLLAECGRLREERDQWQECARGARQVAGRLREQLDAARQALEQIANGNPPDDVWQFNVASSGVEWAANIARAALGEED